MSTTSFQPAANNADSARESDGYLLSLLRDGRTLSIDELKEGLGVTATAVRQRIERLLASGLIEREKVVAGRGRPIFRYRLTVDGHRQAGADVTEFAEAMWLEIMTLRDSPIRKRLISGSHVGWARCMRPSPQCSFPNRVRRSVVGRASHAIVVTHFVTQPNRF